MPFFWRHVHGFLNVHFRLIRPKRSSKILKLGLLKMRIHWGYMLDDTKVVPEPIEKMVSATMGPKYLSLLHIKNNIIQNLRMLSNKRLFHLGWSLQFWHMPSRWDNTIGSNPPLFVHHPQNEDIKLGHTIDSSSQLSCEILVMGMNTIITSLLNNKVNKHANMVEMFQFLKEVISTLNVQHLYM